MKYIIIQLQTISMNIWQVLMNKTKINKLKKIRDTLGETQEQFAHLLGCTFVTVSNWERSKHFPSKKYVDKIIAVARKRGIKLTLIDFY